MTDTIYSKRSAAIIPLLKDESPLVREAAARALERLESLAGMDEVISRLKSGDRAAKIAAIYALGEIGGERVLPILSYCVGRPEEDIRCAAVRTLGLLARPESLGILVERLEDPSRSVRAFAIEALSHFRDAALVPRLIPFLQENDGLLDAEAALALGRIGAVSQVEEISRLLGSPHERSRAAAATALSLLP